MKILLLATAWGPRHGGVNAFNRGLALGLAKHLPLGSVACALPGVDAAATSDAAAINVDLIALDHDGQAPITPEDWTTAIVAMTDRFQPDVVVGHDVLTGEAANLTARAMGAQSAFIHHMHYEAYLGFKAGPERRVADKAAYQRRVAMDADQTFAVGPLLASHLRAICPTVRTLTPGLELAEPMSSNTRLSLTTFGRFDAEDLVIKQAPLVAMAFGRVRQANPHMTSLQDAHLQVIGLKPGDPEFAAELKAVADDAAGRLVNILPLPFTEDTAEMKDRLQRSNLVVAASLHDGFGLTAWEAIGAGAPVIVSRNSGVYRHIDETLEGQGSGCLRVVDVQGRREPPYFREEDAVSLADAIRSVAADLPRAKRDAIKLRAMLREGGRATWEAAADDVLSAFEYTTTVLASASVPAPSPPAAPVRVSAAAGLSLTSRASQDNAVTDFAELLISTTQGSAADRCDILAELRFGSIELGGPQSRYKVGVSEAKLNLTLQGCSVLPGRRAGDIASADAHVVSAPGPSWRIIGPLDEGCLSRRALGDEPLCAVKLDERQGEAKLRLSCRPRDLVIRRVEGDRHAARSVNRNKIIKAFLAKCLRADEVDGVLSTGTLTLSTESQP